MIFFVDRFLDFSTFPAEIQGIFLAVGFLRRFFVDLEPILCYTHIENAPCRAPERHYDTEDNMVTGFDADFCVKMFRELLSVDSTTGQYEQVQTVLRARLDKMGIPCSVTHKGGVIADLGGEGDALAVTAHLDDIGLMVRHVNADGTLNVCPVGGLHAGYAVGENVRVYSFEGRVFTGAVCRSPSSVHVTEEELRSVLPDYRSNVCVVLDEDVKTAEDTRALGVDTGCVIALEPRFTMSNGYLKSRFIDDKACAAALLTVMKTVKENAMPLRRKVYAYFAVYEEIGHGTVWLPGDVRDVLAVDIAPTGPDQNSDERKVSVFFKDSRFPYHQGMALELLRAGKAAGADVVSDIFTPHYGTDADASVLAGYDIRHGAIGPGTSNSHGYERTHIKGLENTYKLLLEYICG